MSHRFKEQDVIDLLSAFEGDYDDGLDAYCYVRQQQDDCRTVATIQITPVIPTVPAGGEGEFVVSENDAEYFRVTVERING